MTEEQINLGNELIAKFMGWKHFDSAIDLSYVDFCGDYEIIFKDVWTEGEDLIENKYSYKYDSEEHIQYHYKLRFNSSWDWLMPVVDKIEKIINCQISIERCSLDGCFYKYCFLDTPYVYTDKKFEGYYESVLNFIQQYNKNKK